MFFVGDIVRIVKKHSDNTVGWSSSMQAHLNNTGYIKEITNSGGKNYPNVKFPNASPMHFCPESLELESDPVIIERIYTYRNPNPRAIG